MNRIYQGKVTAVEVSDGKDEHRETKWKKLADWQSPLWGHHELFHDAINYYTLALAAMGEGIRADTAQGGAILKWCAQVRDNWVEGRRRALRYEGPHRRLARLLKVDPEITDKDRAFEACARSVLLSNGSSAAQRGAAILQLLEEAAKSDLNQLCRNRLPFLCSEAAKFGATSRAVSSLQELHRQKLAREFRDLSEPEALRQAPSIDLGLFLTTTPSAMVTGKDAAKMLAGYWVNAAKRFSDLQSVEEAFFAVLTNTESELRIPSPGRKPSGIYPIAAVFRTLPCPETLAAFREATRSLCQAKDKVVTTDALADVRVGGAPIFDYFTNQTFHREAGDSARAAWFEFDLAAFIEAIKAPHRYFQDTQKRETDADALRARLAAIEAQGKTSSDEDTVFGFADDPRISLLRELVTDPVRGLAYLAEGESSGEGPAEYTIQERTLRGWNVIREKWRTLAERGDDSPEKLWSVVVSEQGSHRDDFGSAALYKKLTEPRYHPIWRDKGTKEWHADDPMRAWREYKELRLELEDKVRPIRFTPAHPIHSPRYFIFPKKSAGSRGGSKHEPGTLAFIAGIATSDGNRWRLQMMRFCYAAPRLRRDELRSDDEQSLESAPWLQPMMKALGLAGPAQQNFGNCRITLQPSGPDNVQLTFPVEIDASRIVSHIGKQSRWSRQFNVTPDGEQFRDATVRWPHEKKPSKPPIPWYEVIDCFFCLSVDLGQREAGAYALLDARANHDFGGKPSRFIGETPGKKWHAALAASGMFRLSGEDRDEWRVKTSRDTDGGKTFDFREELRGSRGRMPRPDEIDNCHALLEAFLGVEDAKAFLPASWDDLGNVNRLSFPEQNDRLLVAARRAQSRVARLHRWCWFLGDGKKRGIAMEEIRETLNADNDKAGQWLPASLKPLASSDNDPRLLQELRTLLESRLKELPGLLVHLANRILPLRGRSWNWDMHPEATEGNRIFLLSQKGPALDSKDSPAWLRGQRGLSMERIEQIAELRKRFQSLNQTLRRDIGGKPPIRRDESVPDPCPDLLDKLDRIKGQRVNQTAHMILAEALGVRLAAPPSNKASLKAERDQHGVYERSREPVDFIVIEDLSRYRASQGRAPRENSRLMKWCHRAVRDKLRELCEPFGIPVLETPAAYSSRFCSRTGVPGFRAVEVSAGFENDAPWCWLKDKQSYGELTEEAKFIRSITEELREVQYKLEASGSVKHPGRRPPRRTLLLPQAGGPIFVPAVDFEGEDKLSSAVIQADINAAINLGLRAISDPRLWTIHPRLRTERLSGEVTKRRKKEPKAATAGENDSRVVQLRAREKRKYGENGPQLDLGVSSSGSAIEDTRNPNYFFDVAGIARWDKASVLDPRTGEIVTLASGKALWSAVKTKQWDRCREINSARLDSWLYSRAITA